MKKNRKKGFKNAF